MVTGTRARTYIYAKDVPNRHKKDTLYPVGHLSLLSPEDTLKVAKFRSVRTERNKRLFNMSAIPADDVQTSPAWNCDRKGSEKFWIEQDFYHLL